MYVEVHLWHCSHSMRSKVYETVEHLSVCLSRHSTAAAECGRFPADRRAGGRYRSTTAAPRAPAGDAENAKHEIAGHENAAPCCRGGKCKIWKCEKRDSMEHRVLHMSVHCQTGMHESTRKSTRFRRQLWVPHLPIWDYHGSASLLVWLWWLEQSSHDVDFQLLTFFLHLHKLCCQLCSQLCCTDYIFIIQFYSSYICHLKNNRRTLRLRLKIDFDTDLTPNITRHSCIISAEMVVSRFINNLVRLSSIVPFHIIYQVNLYWRNNSANKYNYFETLFHTLAFHTNFSRIFHPCNLVPHFHVSHFPTLQVGAANSCLAYLTVPYFHVSHFQSPPPQHGPQQGTQQQMREQCHVDSRRRKLNTDLL